MSAHGATIEWMRGDQPFTDKRYSRAHSWTFDGGAVVPGSSSPAGVPVPLSDASAVDPEEAMVASLSSCHMLWFLAFAANAGLVVDSYRDAASGELDKNAAGQRYLARVALRPVTAFSGRKPDQAELDALHHSAHEHCEMAHSVRAEITIEATIG
ncbi:peroxiredoxin [Brevundimonas sp. EAKA]|jgi:organic hydroperoxide reductase OsmC/OhrA|uniref:OsmC family peroxiredoxin n=1 Tax=Brevundimonas mediterranea TaxID=74329 RepID=A0A7Z8Y592_9CAUL|nr:MULTISPECIES: OsmC family protein [Brevundimonas]MBU4195584.1 OsmC family protein [Alphaproteobacteria bacterium]OGN46821.1 MAG: peroxiredoxin [Caulobacterales bacterium RIFCSPHIGHO2_01_FULL_67_30]KDP94610.1 peroxiredoxin [Brevundimonas sp. EAKA]MBU4238368.1 OsmC family protein [Alphaproteobacteria bacterium]MCG2663396.1 OsmC family protein [Brevundimonas sp.]